MNCKNCKFYKQHKGLNYGECLSEKFIYDYSFKNKPDDVLVYCDNEMYDASFEVGDNFGCIHFKSKE